MIIPEVKSIIITGNPTIIGKLEIDETVDLGDDFLLSGTACIGTKESSACDNFDFTVISPKALDRKLNTTNLINGRACFIVKDFDIKLLKERIDDIISNCLGETWEEIAQKLSPYFYWEYEN
ncbi:Imm8 family immunity protein [Cohnella faecalis]|uniref:Imm8 family immunity protein n=1 Tax=Cohnella faecalis TaxID=2315694 RepID=UPI001314E231|nr:Imm8 family immunity protein [Cohnella faecalis]